MTILTINCAGIFLKYRYETCLNFRSNFYSVNEYSNFIRVPELPQFRAIGHIESFANSG